MKQIALCLIKMFATEEIEEFRQLFGISNAVLAPIASKGNVFGLLITGNELPDFICASTEREFWAARRLPLPSTMIF